MDDSENHGEKKTDTVLGKEWKRMKAVFNFKFSDRETVIRQNRRDQEMNLLVLLCYCFYMAMQLLAAESGQARLSNGINLMLYCVFVPGFIFIEGYSLCRMMEETEKESVRKYLLRRAVGNYACFGVLAVAQDVLFNKLPLHAAIVNAVTAVRIPSISAVFFTMAVLLLVIWACYDTVQRLLNDPGKCAVCFVICLLCAFLRSKTESYAVVAALFGSVLSTLPPAVPYFTFFLMGAFFWKKKPGFQWRLAFVFAAVMGASLLLYRTPLQNLCRVLISFLPVYLIYSVSGLLSDLTARYDTAKVVCRTIGQVFLVYTCFLFGCYFLLGDTCSVWKTLLLAAGVILAVYLGVICFFGLCRVYTSVMDFLRVKVKHKTAAYFVIYTVVFAFFLLIAFGIFLIKKHSFVISGDGVTQYFPRAVYYIRYVRELISNLLSGIFQFPMYDFNIGFGDTIVYNLEPLYLLFALFGEEHAEFTYNLTILLRFYLSGISASIFMLYFRKDYFTTFLASIVYVFCGFAFFAGPMHTMFMIPMIMLPLLIISVEEIMRNRRWYLCTIFVVISLFCNYYFLYMNTIAMGVYFLVRFFCRKEKRTVKEFMTKALTISGSYLLGIGMSCFVLVTTFGMYVGSGRNGDIRIKTPSLFFYDAGRVIRCFLNFITTSNSPGDWMKLGFLPIAMLAVVILFRRKNRRELKIFCVIGAAFSVFPVFGFIFSGFSAVINRWCYMLALLLAFVVAECLSDLMHMVKKDMVACSAVIGVYGLLILFGYDAEGYTVTGHTKAAFLCLLLTFAVLLLCQDGNRKYTARMKQCMLFVLTAVMVFWQSFSFFGINGAVDGYRTAGTMMEQEYDTPLLAVTELEDDSFYRSATPKLDYSTSNSPMLIGTKSITTVCSTQNGNTMEYFEKVGNISYSMTQLLGLNNRTFLESLAAVKYYAYYDDPDRSLPFGYEEIRTTEVNGKETTVCENQYALPLGYTYKEAISEEELELYDVEERSEVMMQKVVLASPQTKDNTQIQVTGQKLEILSVDENNVALTDHALTAAAPEAEEDSEQTGYSIRLHFEGQPNSETYLVLKNAWLEGDDTEEGINLKFYTKGNSSSYKFQADTYRYGSGQGDYVINLGYHEKAIDSCLIKMSRAGMIQFDSFEICSQPMDNLEQYTDTLKEDILENVQTGTNCVTGSISLEEDKILVLSIPYQNGWTACVDGVETELQRANYMYMAIPLEAGEHEIELRYKIPHIEIALTIMAGSAALFVILLVAGGIRKKIRQRKNRE